ncbi:GGDEF domain-containing protein [Ruminiclostridium cellobioparum]|uniref:Diguanylate cyclase (GGDEF) domain-containing protein n=1 Tax=Ruminiclostridium cellobioparum subsp. termitidis CT1112 TaxID=1195236 RepID=S0FND9_RUMCE|nr:GGDEF domain-containing protein [Ruminiclostridium cellobioparum]EMS69998.1 diguanylate cyclase (GGDEF) domain-containing protein [Ruminiclostridium cellobioparum subsp. termitidis CT1112]
MKEKDFEQLLGCLDIIRNMYEHIRFVDPVNSKVINVNEKNEIDTEAEEIKCYTFWGNTTVCKNCISMRAYIENKSFVKIEYNPDKIVMTTAVPVELKEGRVVVELMKDATDSLIFENKLSGDITELLIMIDNINNLAVRDALTGIYNRRYINEKLPIELISSIVNKKLLSVIMIDIDHYKRVNDTYGHLVGDMVLKTLTGIIQSCIRRDTDWLARYGGEEFLVCLPGAPLRMTVEIAESMRKAIESRAIVSGEHEIKVTASFGVSCRIYTKDNNYEDVIEEADKNLLLAKRNGRNRVEW